MTNTRIALVAALLLLPVPAWAQRGYVGVSFGSYRVRADRVDGAAPLAGIGAGIRVKPWLTVEAELLRPTATLQRQYSGVSFTFAQPGASREEIERLGVLTRFRTERRVSVGFSGGVAFHPRPEGSRVQPRVFAGITNYSVSEVDTREPLRLPPGVSLDQILRMQPLEERRSHQHGALTAGIGVAIAVAERLSIVPELRYDYGSIGDEIDDVARAGVRVLWRF